MNPDNTQIPEVSSQDSKKTNRVRFVGVIILCIVIGLFFGFTVTYNIAVRDSSFHTLSKDIINPLSHSFLQKKEVIGFLPYWLLSTARKDYSDTVTTLAYFSLTFNKDGTIMTHTNPQELEPGWYSLTSGKADEFFAQAKKQNVSRSLVIFEGNEETIDALLSDPVIHAQNFMNDVLPLMETYEFTDLNIDIESVRESSPEAQLAYTQFIREVKHRLTEANAGTLTVDIAPSALIHTRLMNLEMIAPIVDKVVLMGYDYHYSGSLVTGPVSPLFGGGVESEFDIDQAVNLALNYLPKEKLLLGIPAYGYQWETVQTATRSATLPGSGITASTKRVEELLSSCSSCIVGTDTMAHEQYLLYPDEETGTYHQIFYPDEAATKAKTDYVEKKKLLGLAVWALGYEDRSVLLPLSDYK